MEPFYLTLLRHGESAGNAEARIQGQADYPLTEKGARQARLLAADWRARGIRFDRVLASPLTRARQTAEFVAEALSLEVECDPAWMERSFGGLQGQTLAEIALQNPPVEFNHPYHPVGTSGESQVDLYLRASQALQNLLRRPPGRYLVVSHGAILNMALYAILGLPPLYTAATPRFHFGNTGYSDLKFDLERRQWRILGLTNPDFQEAHIDGDGQASRRETDERG